MHRPPHIYRLVPQFKLTPVIRVPCTCPSHIPGPCQAVPAVEPLVGPSRQNLKHSLVLSLCGGPVTEEKYPTGHGKQTASEAHFAPGQPNHQTSTPAAELGFRMPGPVRARETAQHCTPTASQHRDIRPAASGWGWGKCVDCLPCKECAPPDLPDMPVDPAEHSDPLHATPPAKTQRGGLCGRSEGWLDDVSAYKAAARCKPLRKKTSWRHDANLMLLHSDLPADVWP